MWLISKGFLIVVISLQKSSNSCIIVIVCSSIYILSDLRKETFPNLALLSIEQDQHPQRCETIKQNGYIWQSRIWITLTYDSTECCQILMHNISFTIFQVSCVLSLVVILWGLLGLFILTFHQPH